MPAEILRPLMDDNEKKKKKNDNYEYIKEPDPDT